MTEYANSYRLFPLWAVLLLTIPAGLGSWGISASSYVDRMAGTPLFLLFGYGLAVGYLNRRWVRVNAEGVAAGFGPLPCGVHPDWVPRDEVRKVYVRYVNVSPKSGRAPYWAAGVERADGCWLDLSDPLAPSGEIREAAQELAAALEWPEPIELVRSMPTVFDRRRVTGPLLLWSGLVMAALVWAVYIELSQRG